MTPTEAAKLQGEMASDIKTASSGHIAIAILELHQKMVELNWYFEGAANRRGRHQPQRSR